MSGDGERLARDFADDLIADGPARICETSERALEGQQ